MNTSQDFDFAAPFVPSADPHDGLLQAKDLNSPVTVLVGVWIGMAPGDYVQLMLNGALFGPVRTLSEDEGPEDVISMQIDPEHLLAEGRHLLGFRVTNSENLTQVDSKTVPIIVDRTAPGAALLAPIVLPDNTSGDPVIGKVPGYAGMQPGDMIQTLCNDSLGPVYRVLADNLTTTPIEIPFTRAFLESLLSDKISMTYHVTDRAGNRSILAHPVELTVAR